jgi:hypothetical protein
MTRKKEDIILLAATSFIILIVSGLTINSITGGK